MSRLADPEAGAREDLANRQLAASGTPVRFCFHADCTLLTGVDEGTRFVGRSCDYCPARIVGPSGISLPQMPPWAFMVDADPDTYTSTGLRLLTAG